MVGAGKTKSFLPRSSGSLLWLGFGLFVAQSSDGGSLEGIMSPLHNGDQKLVEISLSMVQSLVAAPSTFLRYGKDMLQKLEVVFGLIMADKVTSKSS